MIEASPDKAARDGVVAVGSETAMIFISLVGRDPDERASEHEQTADRDALGKAIDFEGAGAALEGGRGGIACTDGERAGGTAVRTSVLRSARSVRVVMVR